MAKGRRGGMVPNNMNNMMKKVQKMQADMEKLQKEIEEKEFEASVGGGAVSVKVNGKKEVVGIALKEEIVDPDDIEMLQDLIMSAVNEALRQAEDTASKEMSRLAGGVSIPGLF